VNWQGNKILSSTSKDKPPQCSQLGTLELRQPMLEQFPSRSLVCNENIYLDEQKKPKKYIQLVHPIRFSDSHGSINFESWANAADFGSLTNFTIPLLDFTIPTYRYTYADSVHQSVGFWRNDAIFEGK
jgi:hypothetical protein